MWHLHWVGNNLHVVFSAKKFKPKNDPMRKVIFDINISIDGCVDHTKFGPGEGTYGYFTDLLRGADQFVFGRKTYELMVPYWPDAAKNNSGQPGAEQEFAQAFDAVDKILVFSRTLKNAEGKNTRIVSASPKEEIQKLKQQPGKNILIAGLEILAQIIDADIIDEYHFVVHPVLVGEGRRLLDGINLQEKLQLKLAETKVFDSGCLALRYVK
jgi:dihydrofolate reductase